MEKKYCHLIIFHNLSAVAKLHFSFKVQASSSVSHLVGSCQFPDRWDT